MKHLKTLNESTSIEKAMKVLDDNDIDNYPGGDTIDGVDILTFDNNEDAKAAKKVLDRNKIKTTIDDNTLEL